MGKTLQFPKRPPSRKVKANQIYQGDNLEIMRSLEEGKIDLIYIDPPFCAQNVFKSKAWGKKEISFNDQWGGGVNSYIHWLVSRFRECHRLLKNTGVLCVHLDWRSVHYAKVELDKVFGEKNFVNEIVWAYKSGGIGKTHFPKKHDNILIYSKTNKYQFNKNDVGVVRNECQGCKKVLSKKNNMKKCIDKDGRIYRTMKSNGKIYKYYDDEKVLPPDVWVGLNHLQQKDPERLGYPTQKPLALLERLIKAFTNKGDVVADFFCGCGTTVSAAQKLERKWLGADISPDAIKVIRKRMAKEHRLKIEVINTNQLTRAQIYRLNPFEFEEKMVRMLGGTPNLKKVGDGGVDGRMYDSTPIQVKKSPNVGRPVVDSFYKHVKSGNRKGIIVAKSFSKTAKEEVQRLRNEEWLEIDLVPSDDLIRGAG